MNPLTNMKNVLKLSEQELYRSSKTSWHDQYKDSAWIFVGGLPYDLTEGDLICIFSQYGEIVNINLIRDKDNGKSKGFCFICYEDQRSTILAVDNLNGVRVLNRIIRVDHVSEYKVPKEGKKTDDETRKLYRDGCAPKLEVPVAPPKSNPAFRNPIVKLEPQDLRETLSDAIQADIKLPARLPIYPIKTEKIEEGVATTSEQPIQKLSEEKTTKTKDGTGSDRKKKKKKHRHSSSSEDSEHEKKRKKHDSRRSKR